MSVQFAITRGRAFHFRSATLFGAKMGYALVCWWRARVVLITERERDDYEAIGESSLR